MWIAPSVVRNNYTVGPQFRSWFIFVLAFKRELICSAMDSGTCSRRFRDPTDDGRGLPFLPFVRCVVVVGLVVLLVVVSVGS